MYKALALAFAAPAFAAEVETAVETEVEIETEVESEQCAAFAAVKHSLVVYEHARYEGKWLQVKQGKLSQSDPSNFNWDNVISSFRVGAGQKVTFCDNDNCNNSGAWNQSFEVVGPHESDWVDVWNDRITHIRIEPHWGGAVTIFESFNCQGNSRIFYDGDYDFGAFVARIQNDRAKGIKVDKATTAFLYQHGGFGGWMKQIEGPATHCNLNDLSGARADDASTLKVRSSKKKRSRGFYTDLQLSQL
jgi:hypothetical protein